MKFCKQNHFVQEEITPSSLETKKTVQHKKFFFRKVCQLSTLLFFCVLPFSNLLGQQQLYGNFLSFSFFGVTVTDPLANLQAYILSQDQALSSLFGSGPILCIAVLFGSVFCSWLCPYGTIAEYADHIIYPKKQKTSHKAFAYSFYIKSGLLCCGFFFFVFFFTQPVLNQLSMPGHFSRFWQALAYKDYMLLLGISIFLATSLLLDAFFKKRFWCRFICPQSVIISLISLLNPYSLQIQFNKHACRCGKKHPCQDVCPLYLDPRSNKVNKLLTCNNCVECIKVCQMYGQALSIKRKNRIFSQGLMKLYSKKSEQKK